MGIGIRIKEALNANRMTIKALSSLADIPLNTLYSITKRDSERIDELTLSRICAVLNLPKSFFMATQPFENLKFLNEFKSVILLDLCQRGMFEKGDRAISEIESAEYWEAIGNNIQSITLLPGNKVKFEYAPSPSPLNVDPNFIEKIELAINTAERATSGARLSRFLADNPLFFAALNSYGISVNVDSKGKMWANHDGESIETNISELKYLCESMMRVIKDYAFYHWNFDMNTENGGATDGIDQTADN